MDKCVFVHTNEKQWLGALVAEYSFRRNSRNPDATCSLLPPCASCPRN
jgi:hypothetical protein